MRMTTSAVLGNYLAFSRCRAAYNSALMKISKANYDAIRPHRRRRGCGNGELTSESRGSLAKSDC
jgi:hypothetical protein